MENWKQFRQSKRFTWYVSDYGKIKKVSLITDPKKKNCGREWMVTPSVTGGNERQGGYLALSSNWMDKYVHRIVAKAFLPNPKGKKTVNHKDGNKLNNHVDNLEWASYSENMQHAIKTGLIHYTSMTPEEKEKRKRERRERYRQAAREERRKVMYARWSPFLLLSDLTINEQRYIRLRMENCNIPTIANRIGIEMNEVYKLRHIIQKKKMKQTGNYNILKLY